MFRRMAKGEHLLRRFIKRLVIWLLLSLPVGIAFGAGFSAYLGDGADLDRFTAAGNGGIAGAWLGLLGAVSAATTTTIAHDRLKGARASEFLTGLVVSYGLLLMGTLLLWVGG